MYSVEYTLTISKAINNIIYRSHRSYIGHIGRLARMSVLDTEVDGSNHGSSMLFP